MGILVIAALILVPIGLPIAVLIDSKKRFGRFRWGWVVLLFIVGTGAISREIAQAKALASGPNDTGAITWLGGTIIGFCLGGFGFYRLFARAPKPRTGIIETQDASLLRPHWETKDESSDEDPAQSDEQP